MASQVPTVKVYYWTPMLPDVSRVLACLYEKDVKFDLVHMYQGQQVNPDVIRFQPSQAHVLGFEDGDTQLFESRKICRHLVNTYPKRGNKYLLGRDLLERASIEQWLKSEEHSFDPPSYTLILNLAFGFEPDRTIIPESERRLSRVLDVYEQRLGESKFLAGDEFSLADLSHLPNSHYLSKSDKWGHLFDSRKNVKNWCNEMSSRNSWQKVVKILKDYGIGGKEIKVNSKDQEAKIMDKKDNELPSKFPTAQSKINGNDKVSTPVLGKNEIPAAGEAASELKSEENQDKRSPKEESREKPRDAQSMPQAKTTEVTNQEENKNRDISGDEDNKIKDNSQKVVLKFNDVTVLKKNPSEDQQTAKEKMSTESPEKLQDDKSSQIIKEETGSDKAKDTTVVLNKQSGTSTESPEKLQNGKSSQTIKEETGPDKAKDLNKQSGTSTESPAKLQDDKSSQTIKEETAQDKAKDTTVDLNKQSGTSTESPENLQNGKSSQTIQEETGPDMVKDLNKQSGMPTESPAKQQDDKSSQTIKEETAQDKANDTTVDLNKQSGTSTESPEKLQHGKSSQTIKEETGPDKAKDLNKQSGMSTESPAKLQDDKSSQTIKEETGQDKAKDTTVDLNKQSGTSTESAKKLQDDVSSQTNKEETGLDKGNDTTGDLNKQSGTSTEPNK